MTTKKFLINIGLLLLSVLVLILLVMLWLNIYTNHGQKLELPAYVGQNIEEVEKDAKKRSFQIIVNDSIHRLNVEGGQVLNQNPPAGAKVKEKRKIYVTIAKYTPDYILSENLPDNIYGRDFEMVKRELANQDIFAKVVGYRFDNAAPNTILEVDHKGKQIIGRYTRSEGIQIAKGDTLKMILTKNSEGEVVAPDLVCQQLSGAKFILSSTRLSLGEIVPDAEIDNLNNGYIYKQNPEAGSTLIMGQQVNVFLTEDRPAGCN